MRFLLIPGAVLISCLAILSACSKKNSGDPAGPGTPAVPKTKKRLLTFYSYTENSGNYGNLHYDSTGRLIEMKSGYKIFYQNDTIHHVLTPVSTFNGEFFRDSYIFLYRADKKCTRVVKKSVASWNNADIADSNPFFTSTSDNLAAKYDSLVYNQGGQLTEIWSSYSQNSFMVSKFEYADVNSETPAAITDYYGTGNDISLYTQTYKTNLFYSNINQEAYRYLWLAPFLDIRISVSPTTPATYAAKYLVLFKKELKNYTLSGAGFYYASQSFVYSYNADSTRYNGRCEPDDITFERIQLWYETKEY